MNPLELAEQKAKEIIILAEQKAKEIVELAKNPSKEIIHLAEEKAKEIITLAKASVPNGVSPEIELLIIKACKEEREKSDRLYAIKLIEVIVFGLLGAIGLGVISYLIPHLFK